MQAVDHGARDTRHLPHTPMPSSGMWKTTTPRGIPGEWGRVLLRGGDGRSGTTPWGGSRAMGRREVLGGRIREHQDVFSGRHPWTHKWRGTGRRGPRSFPTSPWPRSPRARASGPMRTSAALWSHPLPGVGRGAERPRLPLALPLGRPQGGRARPRLPGPRRSGGGLDLCLDWDVRLPRSQGFNEAESDGGSRPRPEAGGEPARPRAARRFWRTGDGPIEFASLSPASNTSPGDFARRLRPRTSG